MKLYKWQESCLQKWKEHEYQGIVNVITGAGKTMVALAAIDYLVRQYPDLRVKIVVPTIPLANQWNQTLLKHMTSANDMPGFFGGGRRDSQDRRIMIYIINSARAALSQHIQREFSLNHPVFLICDECHHYQSKENRKIFDFLVRSMHLATAIDPKHSTHAAHAVCVVDPEPTLDVNPDISVYTTSFTPGTHAPDMTPGTHAPDMTPGTHAADMTPGTHVPDMTPGTHATGTALAYDVIHNLYHCMGLSATPFGTQDDRFLTSVLGDEIFSYGFQEASADHIISSFYICQIAVSFLPAELKKYQHLTDQVRAALGRLLAVYPHLEKLEKTDFMKAVTAISHKSDMDPEEPATQFLLLTYQRKSISVLSQARLLCAINLIRGLPEHSHIILFCEQMEQAEEIYRMIERSFGPIAGLYHSGINAEARKRIISQFRDRSIRVLCSCRCLDEGIDVPDADVGIVISSSAVSRQRIQRLGRIIRHSPDKHAACLYYLYVRESTDDAIYLNTLEGSNIFSLRYYTSENSFSNELYEYTAREILERQKRMLSTADSDCDHQAKVLAELRSCLIEGLIRPDYLLPASTQNTLMKTATTTHQKNYWHTMKLIGKYFQKAESSL